MDSQYLPKIQLTPLWEALQRPPPLHPVGTKNLYIDTNALPDTIGKPPSPPPTEQDAKVSPNTLESPQSSHSSDAQERLRKKKRSDAVRKCRQKKEQLLKDYKRQVEESSQEQYAMTVKLAVLEAEKQAWKEREKQLVGMIEMLRSRNSAI